MNIEIDKIENLIKVMKEHNLEEIEFKDKEQSIRLKNSHYPQHSNVPFPNLYYNCSGIIDRMFISNICTTYMDWENPLLDLNSVLEFIDNSFQINNVDEEAIYVWDRSKWDTSGMTDKNQILQWGGFVRSNAAGDWVDINESYLPNVREYATNASNWYHNY